MRRQCLARASVAWTLEIARSEIAISGISFRRPRRRVWAVIRGVATYYRKTAVARDRRTPQNNTC